MNLAFSSSAEDTNPLFLENLPYGIVLDTKGSIAFQNFLCPGKITRLFQHNGPC
jgi:hypothetical protein